MKKLIYLLVPLVLACFLIITAALPQEHQRKRQERNRVNSEQNALRIEVTDYSTQQNRSALKCKSCHTSEYPTPKDPGLIDCPRENLVSVYQSPKEGPESVIIDEMSDKYSGVVFSHRVHAEMSEMSTGCAGCHHYNTTGPILNCRKCHERSRNREDVSVPDLKAAFHRQCLSCHKQWSGENGCNSLCHTRKVENADNRSGTFVTKIHPVLPEPGKITWETNSDVNKTVTFFHDEHVKLFDIKCTSCHTSESCIKCHVLKGRTESGKPVKIEKTLEEHHKPCIKCHYGNKCTKCHFDKEMSPFDHAKTSGWVLKTYHSKLACAKCHGNIMPYRSMSSKCISCHKEYASDFDHKLIGITFSEAHAEIECANCHAKSDFTKTPVCSDCHDDKTYPADLPGSKSN
jgi:Class III cytochrome C family/Cytochrome c3